MSDAMIGYTSEYAIFDGGSPGTYVDIDEVFNIVPGQETSDRVEVTHYQSPDRRREWISGMIDSGEASFEINWVPGSTSDLLIRGLFESGDVASHRITFPNGKTCTYDATIIGYEKAMPLDDRMVATVTVGVSGSIVWA